jgi:hypothetical protein
MVYHVDIVMLKDNFNLNLSCSCKNNVQQTILLVDIFITVPSIFISIC